MSGVAGLPDDELGAAAARRDPWNDAREQDDPEWYAIYLDRLGRMSTLTEPSFVTWQGLLAPDDLPHVHGFIDFFDRRRRDHVERTRGSQ